MSLNNIIGQDKAVDMIKTSVSEERIAHAYLFLGPQGAGKTKAALEFAKLLNCYEQNKDSCDRCASCVKIEKASHPDINIINRPPDKTQIPIESIRALRNRFSLKSFEARYKVAIIEDAEYMNEQASNALLKLLEEPSDDTVIILTAANQRSILSTIISRCQIIRFGFLSKDEVASILMKDFGVDEKEASFLSTISGANIKKAHFYMKEDIIDWKNKLIDAFILNKNTGLEHIKERERQFEALDLLLKFYRDVLVYKLTANAGLLLNIDRKKDIAELSQSLSVEYMDSCISSIEKARQAIEANGNPKLVIRNLQESIKEP
jgi:DNA polymerase-3 subunit delta'